VQVPPVVLREPGDEPGVGRVGVDADAGPAVVAVGSGRERRSRPRRRGRERCDEAERHVEAGQQFPQLVPGAVIDADDAEQLEGSLGIPGQSAKQTLTTL
jgi:hypothetical protein